MCACKSILSTQVNQNKRFICFVCLQSSIMSRMRSGERVCERVNDLESVDVSRASQLQDPLISLEAWEVS